MGRDLQERLFRLERAALTDRPDTFARVADIIREATDNAGMALVRETTARDVPRWDSLAMIVIITAIERRFAIAFPLGALDRLRNVGDLVDTVEGAREEA